MISLREYQGQAVKSAIDARRRGRNRITLCSPVGSGKTAIMAELCRLAKRPIALSPSLNLMHQLHGNLEGWLSERVGIEQGLHRLNSIAGLKERVAVCSYASMMSYERGEKRYRKPCFDGTTLVIVDECHLNVTPSFRQMMSHFEGMGATIVGLSATPYRGRGKPLPYWDRPCFSYSLLQAIRDGYLVRPRAVICESTSIDLSQVEEVAHEWRDDQLNAVLEAERTVQELSSLVLQTYHQKPSAVYCNSVAQAKLLSEVFGRYGVQASIVYSAQGDEERKSNMDAFTNGETKIICNVGILAYGWDFPQLINIYNAAPTQSLAVYEQRIGRGTRLLPGTIDNSMTLEQRVQAIAASEKPHFNIYDITDTSRSLQLVNALDLLDQMSRDNAERRERAMKALKDGGDVLDQIEAQDAIDQQVSLEDPDLKQKRSRLLVGVSFGHEDRDLFSEPEAPREKQRGWRMLWGPHKGKLLRDLPTDYLAAISRRWSPKGGGKSRALHAAIATEHQRRRA
jgi:superfamily II DNA or RNA helicase